MSMEYDLTPLLTTIAAASASIVAILGGFIAGKLITISGDREAVLTKIAEAEQQMCNLDAWIASITENAQQCTAIVFISSNIEALIDGKELSAVYRRDIQHNLSEDELLPYWNQAADLLKELIQALQEEGKEVNENGLPIQFAEKYAQDYFAYEVGSKIMKHFAKKARKATPPYFSSLDIEFEPPRAQSIFDVRDKEKKRSELKWLRFQRNNLLSEKKRLSRPKGMALGLVIFATFSVFCIIFPLLLVPSTFSDYSLFLRYKIITLVLFTAGLISIFSYLVYLLKWKEDEKR